MELAKALGYSRPNDFRKLIKRHASALKAMGSLRHGVAMIEAGKGAKREVTEYQLSFAQAAFLVGKAGTTLADSLAVKMAEVFALYTAGRLVAVDAAAQAELDAIAAREAERRRVHEEEKDARDMGFRALRGHW
ncbi:hypothetical protein GCM10007874_68990 [Labrys miyagiensis]|uniref:Uncharacterized protein n=1 Tax=Labrys miyagiensis TaxID=346912 RepID=A0ABQ6CUA2_9HYPH|nr:hypothetical protein [Labrys miyagiensis]GLS23878.1 hypothetical protein GCM10007874_68990 [Labrys miyagiensis]